jgi:hypothetical protein
MDQQLLANKESIFICEAHIKDYKLLLNEGFKNSYPDWYKDFLREMKNFTENEILKISEHSNKYTALINSYDWGKMKDDDGFWRNLKEYAEKTIQILEHLKGVEYAKYFIDRKCKRFKFFGKQITSTAHGIDFFDNIVKYWDDPDSYLKSIKGRIIDKDAIKKGRDYELNFVLLLKQNKK